MATPTSVSSSSTANTKWGRSGEPGSAFNGLSSRAGRGGRGRGGPRGRGGSRTITSSHKDSKHEDGHRQASKSDNSHHVSINADKMSSSVPVPPATSDQLNTNASSSKPKPPSRRASRVIPPIINTQSLSVEVASAPVSAKPPSRRRRSQTSKLPPNKINPPAPNDNLLRPNKPRLAPAPHTAPIKDTPPHLNQRLGMRNDIDALVERVRAVAMDNNRPSTPGSHSHIDWAGDDDDGLPDLDDWGVTPAMFASTKSDVISPLIVGGLKSLPDVPVGSFPSSPLKQSSTISEPRVEKDSQNNLPTPIAPTHPSEAEQLVAKAANVNVETPESEAELKSSLSVRTKSSISVQDSRSRKPLHPSLPAKPVAAPLVSQLRARPGATPMRTYPKSPISATKDNFTKEPKFDPSSEASVPPETLVGEQTDAKVSSGIPSEVVTTIDAKTPQAPESMIFSEPARPIFEVQSAKESLDKKKGNVKSEDDEIWGGQGLSASIHAPKAISDAVSAPATVSTYPDLPSEHPLTHIRAHTVGRPPSFPKPSLNEYVPRFTRSGHTTPSSAFQGQQHVRTRSTPPTGVANNQQRTHSNRPIITGDAISRLARTIGKTGISSTVNTKPQPVGSPGP
ncbi:hypothetical protein CPB84DRAFT_1962904 [Gymnopilus junonius]|uniref:Uncharacterized protein n=1 Tax=Gymnopilus junonius TaxID=109634 RepID=A0A9P5NJH7_GYMJU|nr:hypothetical protein CPB84DRAFT_1962904 [Gymnopilus junonius]